MKKSVKIINALAIVLVLTLVLSNIAMAVNPATITGDTTGTTKITNVGKQIVGVVQVVGSVISVLMIVVLGIKYMLGSAEEKSEYKKTMVPYLIGAVLIFAASNLAGMVYSFAESVS